MAQRVAAMSLCQRHRGPDDEGLWSGPGACLAHRRLAILDLSAAGRNPMVSADLRYTIIYNGEVFNYLELRAEIGARYPFQTQTDTEVVLAAYQVWGEACLDRFVGMYAFAIWDAQERRLFCARDRFGIKPLYYAEDGGRLLFGSEIKALLAGGIEPAPYPEAFADYLVHGFYDHAEFTFFAGIHRLLPGHALLWQDGKVRTWRYWRLEDEVASAAPDLELLRGQLTESVGLALRSDVPVGVNLSGGLDSSVLLGLLDTMLDRTAGLDGFTQDYEEERFSERPWVEAMAQRTGRTVHLTTMREKDLVDSYEAVLWHQDEPFGGVPTVGYVGLYQSTVREGVKVLLDGNGLDEGFAGYRQHHNALLLEAQAEGVDDLDALIADYAREWSVPVSQVRADLAPGGAMHAAGVARDGSREVCYDWLAPELRHAGQGSVPAFPRPFASAVHNARYRDLCCTKIPRALRFNDRISMAFSRELRVPFLDHRLVRLGFAAPARTLFHQGRPKGLIRSAVAGLLPDEVRLAPKRHVQSPQSHWFSTTLRSWVGDFIHSASLATRGLFDVPVLRQRFNELAGQELANSFFLWQVLEVESWFRMFVDGAPAAACPFGLPDFPKGVLHGAN